MNDIQKARDVLAKWREKAHTDNPWVFEAEHYAGHFGAWVYGDEDGVSTIGSDMGNSDARLIVGTAGNPDLLEAIDGLLLSAPQQIENYAITRIAAAIIAADERMNSISRTTDEHRI